MRAFLAAMLLAGASTPAEAEEWYFVSGGDDHLVFADADSVQQSGDAVTVRGFFGSSEPLDVTGTPPVVIWYWITQFEFLCESDQYRVTHNDSYNGSHVLEYSDDQSEAWAHVPTESIVGGLQKFACDGVRISPTGDPFDFADEIFFGSDK